MKNKIHESGDVMRYTNSTDAEIPAGTAVVLNGGFGATGIVLAVTCGNIASGAAGDVSTKGVFELPKKTSVELSQGDGVKLDGINIVSHSGTGDPDMQAANAYVFADSLADDTTVLIKLIG